MNGCWVEPDIRDTIIQYVQEMSSRSMISIYRIIIWIGITPSKYYDWISRSGMINFHNGKIPRFFWVLPEEREAIIQYCKDRLEHGYRYLTYLMLDENIAAVSPSTTYRILKQAGLLRRWKGLKKVLKGKGFHQPTGPNQHWHTDIAYVNILGTIFFLITILDGYSRKVIHHEIRTHMAEYDVELTIQRAKEKYPNANPRLISDNGPQFIAKELKIYLREIGLTHIHTSVGYPQSNGKLERFHLTIKSEAIRRQSYVSLEDARRQIAAYIDYYNTQRLHSGIYYLTPQEVFDGKMIMRLEERQCKLDQARDYRRNYNLNHSVRLSISR